MVEWSITTNHDTKTVYLHLWNWTGGGITVFGPLSNVAEASFLDTDEPLKIIEESINGILRIELPDSNNTERLRIVKLKLRGDVRLVRGYELDTGKEYRVVYSPYEDGPELEVITQMQ